MKRNILFFWFFHLFLLICVLLTFIFDYEKIGFVLTAVIASIAIFHNNKINRRRATIDLLLQAKSEPLLVKAKQTLSNMTVEEMSSLGHEECIRRENLASPDKVNTSQVEESKQILFILNWYEIISVGIREGALDYKMYHRQMHSITIRDWEKLEVFIIQLRNSQPKQKTAFQEFQWLATDFKNNRLKQNFKTQ